MSLNPTDAAKTAIVQEQQQLVSTLHCMWFGNKTIHFLFRSSFSSVSNVYMYIGCVSFYVLPVEDLLPVRTEGRVLSELAKRYSNDLSVQPNRGTQSSQKGTPCDEPLVSGGTKRDEG